MKLWVIISETPDYDSGEIYKSVLKVTDKKPTNEYMELLEKSYAHWASVVLEEVVLNAGLEWLDIELEGLNAKR